MNNFRKNLLCFYPFKKDSLILEIYQEESCLDDARSIKLDELNEINDKYDYIVLNGVIRFVDKDYLLDKCNKLLNNNGHILLVTENRLGTKYLSGYKDEYDHKSYSSLNGTNNNPSYTKKELETIIRNSGYKNYRFYYPNPDYRNAYEIFTDNSIDKLCPSSIDNSLVDDNILLFDNTKFTKDIFDNGGFDVFSNSFLIDISNDDVDNDIDYVKISFNRKDEFKLYTQIDYENKKVYKKAKDKKHISSIENNKWSLGIMDTLDYRFNGECLECDLIEGISLYDAIKKDNSLLDKFKDTLLTGELRIQEDDDRFNEVFGTEKVNEPLHWLNRANIDILLDNIFIKDNKWIIIDPEWVFDFDIPAEFVLYRSLKDTEYRDCIGLDETITDIFDKWDEHFVYKYVGTNIVDYKGKEIVYLDDLYQKAVEYEQMKIKLESIENSTIWKASKPLRDLLDKRKK